MALAHKGLEAEFVPCRFTEKDKFAFSRSRTVPVLVDGEEVVSESWDIAVYLDRAYPDRPSLFGGDHGQTLGRFIYDWADTTLISQTVQIILPDIYEVVTAEDRDYFRTSREGRFGKSFADMRANRTTNMAVLNLALRPLRVTLAQREFVAGDAPAFADYAIFGCFQWARCTSADDLLASDDPIHAWRRRMLDLFDGYARGFAARAVS